MLNNPSINAKLIGYTDETGVEKRNIALSQDRAKRVLMF